MEKMRRKDFILIGGLLLIGLLFFISLRLFAGKGQTVRVTVNGEIMAEYPLAANLDTVIEGADGGTNRLIIRDGKAWIAEASCPDGVCVRTGEIDRVGQSIICLPNKVVVEIVGVDNDDTVDAVTGR